MANLWVRGHVSTEELWEALARYPYLPRLRDRLVLFRSVQDGPSSLAWQAEGFALAEGYDNATGRYMGLVVGPGGSSGASRSTLLVQPELALAQAERERPPPSGETAPTGDSGRSGKPGGEGPVPPPPPEPQTMLHRFHGSVVLRSDRLNLEFGCIVQEVIQHLHDARADVEVTVEIAAIAGDGFDEATVRTVTENARTLRFKDGQGFERD